MAEVDPHDDTLKRYVLMRYADHAARHERRNRVIAAYDREEEFLAAHWRESEELDDLKLRGEAEAVEHISGMILEPGHTARARARRVDLRRFLGGKKPRNARKRKRRT